jgi:hypothetical protein
LTRRTSVGPTGVALDLRSSEGQEIARQLIAEADVLIENFRPGTMDKLGLGWPVLKALNPRLIYTCISGYGHEGPHSLRPAYDSTAQAAGGLWSMNGEQGHAPLRVGTIIGDLAASFYATIGTLAALRDVERSGLGQRVDIAQQDSVVTLTESAIVNYTVAGKVAGVRVVAASGEPGSAPSIRLRGATSIAGSQEPLIIIDGTISRASLADIAAEDIDRIEVIKGAAASSLYGSDAAIDLATATLIEREKDAAPRKLEVPNPDQDSTYLSVAAFIANARGKKTPLNNAESARISTLTAMMGRKSIYERRVVTWEEVDI